MECEIYWELKDIKSILKDISSEEGDILQYCKIIADYLKKQNSKFKEIRDTSELIDGEFYFTYRANNKLNITLSGDKNSNNNNTEKEIPVIAYCKDSKLHDIITDYSLTLNPLDLYLNDSDEGMILLDYAVRMNQREMMYALNMLKDITQDEEEEYFYNLLDYSTSKFSRENSILILNR